MDYSYLQMYQTLPRRRRRPYPPVHQTPAAPPENNGWSVESWEDRVHKLQTDKESLLLQVSVVNDQVEAQGYKITDLEAILDERLCKLQRAEDVLQNELLSRTSLETHKLDLMAEISNLKLKLATSEKERKEIEEKFDIAQKRINDLQARLNDKIIEVSELKSRVNKNGTIPNNNECTVGNNNDVDFEDFGGDLLRDRTMEKEKTLDRLKRKHTEVERLKKAVESLMVANDEKEHHIEDLRKMLKKYKRLEEIVLTTQGKKALENLGLEDDRSSTSSTQNSLSSNENTIRDNQHDRLEIVEPGDKDHPRQRILLTPSATSTPVNSYSDAHQQPAGTTPTGPPSPPSVINYLQTPSPRKTPVAQVQRSNSAENLSPMPAKTPPTILRHPRGYGTLPNESSAKVKHKEIHNTTLPSPRKNKGFASFGKGIFKFRTGKWSSSAPNLAENEAEEEAIKDAMAQEYKAMQTYGPQEHKKRRGLKKFFGRLRRSSSQDLDNDKFEDFKRSGMRATAGPRLGWSRDMKYSDIDVPFARWDTDRVAMWLHSIGLSMYVGDCKRWVKNGDHLLKATSHDLEKEMGIRNHFHRKKLQLALQAIGSSTLGQMDELDPNWVTRWLDDIGLPQYKDQFIKSMVDGRMLHYLTVDDLVSLGVFNTLHHLSIRQGIAVLRKHKFNPICLKRRPAPDEGGGTGKLYNCPEEVMLWTNHRVMEWLRTIDLSEYAPNLRGSGVHGGLMVLEPRFSANLFASILSIPSSKTLLRRHLNTHFVALIGTLTQMRKRDCEAQPGYIPLTPSQKLKFKKFGLFGHRRTRSDTDVDDYVCPLEITGTIGRQQGLTNGTNGSLSRHHSARVQKTAKQIGAFSNEMNTLTTMLAKDQFLDDVPTSNV